MSKRAEWAVGIVGVVGTALGVVFFIATQTITWRDVVVLVIGAFVGAMVVALLAVWRFHADERATSAAAEIAAAEVGAAAEAQRLRDADEAQHRAAQTIADAEADAIRSKAAADAEATMTVTNARAAQIAKQTELLATRLEHVTKLQEQIALTEQNANTARGNADASTFRGREAAGYGFYDDAREHEENAKNWRINVEEFERRLPILREQRDRIGAMTDEEFLAAQKRERGME